MSPSRASLAAALLLPAGFAAAQEPARTTSPESTAVVALPAIEVTVTRQAAPLRDVPVAVSLVPARQIQATRATLGLDEALALVPGVLASNRNNFEVGTRLSIRGFGARAAFGVRGIRVLVDGIPLTDADGQAKLTSVDLGSAGGIEVIRGPASTLYGNAAGGVISLRTEAPPPAVLAAQARVIAGDEGAGGGLGSLTKYQLKLGGHAGRAAYIGSLARTDTHGFRENSHTRLTLFNGNASFALDRASTLRLLLSVADQPLAGNPGALPLDSALSRPRAAWPNNVRMGAAEAIFQAQTGLTYTRQVGSSRLEVTVYGSNRTVDNPLPYAVIDLNRHGGGVRSTLSASGRLAGVPATLVGGMDVELQRDARREFTNLGAARRGEETRDQIDRVSALGPFLEAELTLAPRLRLTLGERYDVVAFRTADRLLSDGDDSGSRLLHASSPRASLLYDLGKAASLYATVATSFQTPTTTELINAPPAPGESCCAGGFNQRLEPERASSWEAGVKGTIAGRLRYDIAAYTMEVRDEIVSFRVPAVPDRAFYRNAARSRHRGIELGLQAAITDFLELDAAYTLSRFSFLDDGLPDQAYEGNRLPGVPPQQLFARAVLRFAGVETQAEVQHVSRFFVDDANTAANPAYTVANVRIEGRGLFHALGAEPFLAVENLFGERYNGSVVVNAVAGRYYEPAPGRHFLLGLTLPVGGWPR